MRADCEDSDALAEALISAARPLSVETLCRRLGGMTPERLDKARAELHSLGAPLVGRDGFSLPLADPLDAAAIRAALPLYPMFDDVIVRRVCVSTNDRVRVRTGRVLCVAEAQTAGRGRRGNVWLQPFGAGLALSLGAPAPRGRPDPLAIAMAVTVARTLIEFGWHEIGLKWPNDLYARGRKLGGALVEFEGGAASRVVVGLGLNVRAAPALAGRDAIALAGLDGPPPQRNLLAARCATALAKALDRFDAEGFTPFAREFAALDVLAGREVVTRERGSVLRGVARGINDDGSLILDTENGRLRLTAGEVTLGAWQPV